MLTIRALSCMLWLCLLSCSSQAEEPPIVSKTMDAYYNRQTRISDVMNDPAFGDYDTTCSPLMAGLCSVMPRVLTDWQRACIS